MKEYKIRDELFGEYTEMVVNKCKCAQDKIKFWKDEIIRGEI